MNFRIIDHLENGTFIRAVGVHDAIGAVLAERAGFEAIWAGGLGISSSQGLPDSGLLTMTEFHSEAVTIRRASRLPVIADVDAGFGDVNVIRRMIRLYESSDIEAVCIEDKKYPRVNSFLDGNILEDPQDFAEKIRAAVKAKTKDEFLIIARIESLMTGAGQLDALERAKLYCEAGADAILIHSKSHDYGEIREFCAVFKKSHEEIPIFAIPTTYYSCDGALLNELGVSCAIYANQVLRAMVRGAEELLESLAQHGSTAGMEGRIAPLSDVLRLADALWNGLGK